MSPTQFKEQNCQFAAPEGEEAFIEPISAFRGQLHGGGLDGYPVVIVAWKPDEEDLQRLQSGGVIYLRCIGGLPPHTISTIFLSQ